jgi:UDP-N-acetylmuramoyl-tripeptide--D-alanyl-D-alanine ligase
MAWNKQAYRPRIVTPDAADRALFTLHTPTGQAPVRLRLPGDHQVANALAAACAAFRHSLGHSA